ncbi:MAG: homoserine O-succinyltransferase [bacterium]|jgi:homoserine O-succinyltransferase
MTVILPPDYHAQKLLEENKVICITPEHAERQNIRPLRIGILNIMPKAQEYEFNLLHPLGRSILQIIPVWIRLESHDYSSTNKLHLNELYISYEEAIKDGPLDGMIITGAPVESLEFKDIRYWDEIQAILIECRENITSTMGICWGALAMAKSLGIEKHNYPEKLFGVFETRNLNKHHHITGGLSDLFWLPHSRHAGIKDELMEEAEKAEIVNLLCHSKETGYSIFETPDHKFLMNTGHFEYNSHRIVEEAERDHQRPDVKIPQNFDVKTPMNLWRGSRNDFFTQWIKYCYERIS